MRSAAPPHTIDVVDLPERIATTPPSIGIYKNEINVSTMLAVSPNGNWILGAMADGNVFSYSAPAGAFVASRKDFGSLSGSYAASSFDQFIVGNHVLDSALVPVADLETDSGTPSGFVFMDQQWLRTTMSAASAPGMIQRVMGGRIVRPTRTAEAPLTGNAAFPFTRTLAVLPNGQTIVSLTASGFTRLGPNYDAAVAIPSITGLVNAADQAAAVAPGGLVTISGSNLGAGVSGGGIPLPTFLGGACLTVNGVLAPISYLSPTTIQAQLPFTVSGSSTLTLHGPGGLSNGFSFSPLATAPAIFRSGTAGDLTGIPTVVRGDNGELVTFSNPVHQNSGLTVYLTGMGVTNPQVAAGAAGPSSDLATVLTEPEVTLGGMSLSVEYAGLAPGMVGVYQLNVRVPFSVPQGDSVPFVIIQGGYSTAVNLRVVK